MLELLDKLQNQCSSLHSALDSDTNDEELQRDYDKRMNAIHEMIETIRFAYANDNK